MSTKWVNLDFRHKLDFCQYWDWCTIYFKEGHEVIDSTGTRHEFVYGTPANDTQPPAAVGHPPVGDENYQIPPFRVFYILCQGRSVYTGLHNGIMTDIPGINSITSTIDNTKNIGSVLMFVRPPTNWKPPEIQTIYVEPGEQFQRAESARGAEEHTAATLPPESADQSERGVEEHTAATLPPESEYHSRSPLVAIQSAENTRATLSPFKYQRLSASQVGRHEQDENSQNYGGKTKRKKRKRRKSKRR